MAFTEKRINVSFTLKGGNFQGGGNTATANGLRVQTTISVTGNEGASQLQSLAVYGMPLSTMNQLSNMGTQLYKRKQGNTVQITAGDAESGMSLVYDGLIFDAYVDANNQPFVCFRVTGNGGGGYWAAQQVPPITKQGPQQASTMLQTLAGQMGMKFENNGVNVTLVNPYYPGTPWQQAVRICRHANIDMVLDRGTMAITPGGQPRAGDTVLISPATGMVGYPTFRQNAVIVKALFAPTVRPLGLIQIQSELTAACGVFRVNSILYELASFTPNGPWYMTMDCTPGSAQPP
jgi:hypothetical protein